ncbi:MAG: hypothetical protein ACXAB4_08545 [Candidatus Hodarchaeales archaeon]|jgi:hypothetical protein
MSKRQSPKVSPVSRKVGLISRIDYGSRGFRKGILDVSFELLKSKGVDFIILAGGLVSRDMTQQLKDYINDGILQDRLDAHTKKVKEKTKFAEDSAKRKKRKTTPILDPVPKSERLKERKEQLRNEFLRKRAEELAKIIPSIIVPDPEDSKKEKQLDLFIITSPAFDGEVGEIIANILASLRPDVRVWNKGGDRFLVKYVDKLLWVLTPMKAVWMRGDYYSTPVERVIKDKVKQTSQTPPDLFVVGCFGASINKPKGELPYQYVSVPALSRLEATRVNENQVGVGVLEFPADNGQHLFSVYSLKDLVARELGFIIPPDGATKLQKRVIEVMKSRGWVTPGILRYKLGDVNPDRLLKALRNLRDKKRIRRMGENWPGITEKGAGKKFYFDLEWVQTKLKFRVPSGPFAEDRIASFACLHAGSVETDYGFFLDKFPKYILKKGATILIGAGDIKEGMKHGLFTKGEVVAGMNSTKQEKFAAHLIGEVIFKVFKERFEFGLLDRKDRLSDAQLTMLISESLLSFYYILGNHDLWETEDGHDPLELFHLVLSKYITERIAMLVAEKAYSCPYDHITALVDAKIEQTGFFDLPSGLKVSIQHPHMARAKTTSLRPQAMLEFARYHGCQVAIGANFHVSENVEEWHSKLGQTVCQEIGTIKHGSNFERRKMKTVDQGVGFLKVISHKDEDGEVRIFSTESAFYGEAKARPPIETMDLVNVFVQKLGIPLLK